MDLNVSPCTERIAQIENNTNCNYKCWFCQNRYYNTPSKRVMNIILFKRILESIRESFTDKEINLITFSVYNEPSLDPNIITRIQMMASMGFKHSFVSNGSNITPDIVDCLVKNKDAIEDLRINLPTVDPKEAKKVIGIHSSYLEKILKNLEVVFDAIEDIIPVKVMVNGDGTFDHKDTFYKVFNHFKTHKIDFSMSGLANRAGMLDHVIGPKVDHGDRSVSCVMNYFDNLYFDVEANLYLCCNDYFQEYTYGNIKDGSIKDLIKSRKRAEVMDRFTADFCRYCSMAKPRGGI